MRISLELRISHARELEKYMIEVTLCHLHPTEIEDAGKLPNVWMQGTTPEA